jgi:hypothetical protein
MFSPSAAAFSGIPFSPINTSGFAAWPAVAQQQTYQQQQQQQQQDFYAGGSAFNRLNAEKAPQTTNGPLKMAARKQQSNSEQQNDFNLSSVPNNISGRRTSLSRTAKRGRLAM